MFKYSLVALAAAVLITPAAQAQVNSGMSMDEQIARIRQAELEIQALDAAKEQERVAAEKKAADIQKRAEQARAKARAAEQKVKAERQKKLQAYDDQARELELESKRLDIELKKAQVDLQKKIIEAKGGRCTGDVSGKTNYLVIGDFGSAGAKKVQKALEQKEKGKDIKIITEYDLFRFLQ